MEKMASATTIKYGPAFFLVFNLSNVENPYIDLNPICTAAGCA